MLPRSFSWPSASWAFPWRDELRVLIQPRTLTMLRIKRGMKARVVAKEDIALRSTSESFQNREFWHPAVSSLHQQLQSRQWRGCQPRVVVSNYFAHYAIVPWNASLHTRKEQSAFVRHYFTQVYGEFSRAWDIRTTPVAYGHPTFASAIDEKLLQALRDEFNQARMPVQHIHPHLMIATDVIRRKLARTPLPDALNLVMLENDRITIALVQHGQWLSLQSYAAESDIENQLQALLDRESIIAGVDNSEWPIVFYATDGRPALQLPGRKVHNILPSSQDQHGMEAWQ
ncbi:hypothetical protein ACKF11_07250 [Methylobacillus sp. Pita2]|uniref:hypothetical protein n=1 Tax=Methylobacillus sp. Pita2 TaxID=3383245 RepID=UPI0038B61CE5